MSDISVGSVSVDVVPDASGLAARIKAQTKGISINLGISIDTAELRSQLAEVSRDRGARINVEADTAAAEAQIDTAARTREATVDVNTRGVSQAGAGISGILVAVLALTPALAPILATVTALGAGLTLPLAAAGGGLTVFGLLAGKSIKDTNKVAKQIAELKKRADTLVDPAAAAKAKAQAKALEESLTGPQRAFLAAKESLSGAFEGLLGGKNGRAIFAPIVSGMELLARILPSVSPLLQSVSGAISGVLKGLGQAASGAAFKSFVAGFATLAGKTITTAANVLASFVKGTFNLLVAFLPLSKSFGTGLSSMGKAFVTFSQKASTKNGIQSFIGYLQTAGPQVLSVIGSLVKAIVHIGVALAPIGAIVLGSIKALSDAISAIPTPVLGAIASAIIAITLALKAWAIVQAVINGLILALTTTNPIGLIVLALAGLVAAFVYAYKNSETFRNIVNGVFEFLKNSVLAVVNFVSAHWRLILGILTGPIGAASILIISNFGKIKTAGSSVVSWVASIPAKLKNLAKSFGDAGTHLIKSFVNGLSNAGSFVSNITGNVIDAVRGAINAAIDKINSTLKIHIDWPGPGAFNWNANIGHLAVGTDNWRGGPTWVGERGPEILDLPRGSRVIANDKVDAALGRSTSESGTADFATSAQIERLIAAVEAQRKLIVGQREFALAVQDANTEIKRQGR